ncbi:hypothetical protein [Actinomadura keratinilytica]|uniref:hypothetical protein n=1 Tax=Actinomadura keratinilytica TaxID=547461 RepID=UPI00360854FB
MGSVPPGVLLLLALDDLLDGHQVARQVEQQATRRCRHVQVTVLDDDLVPLVDVTVLSAADGAVDADPDVPEGFGDRRRGQTECRERL